MEVRSMGKAFFQTILDWLPRHFNQEYAVITAAPVAFGVCVLVAFAGAYFALRLYFQHELSSRDEAIRIHEERHKLKDEQLSSLTNAQPAFASGGSQRRITREQWDKIEAARRASPQRWPRLSIKLPFNDLEAEDYARGFSRLLYCGVGHDARITAEFKGLILRVHDRTAMSPGAQYFSQTLKVAGIAHEINELDLQFPIDPKLDCELVIGGHD
jgi:hypothetical protein